jgi:hypothetical protein
VVLAGWRGVAELPNVVFMAKVDECFVAHKLIPQPAVNSASMMFIA